MMVKIPPRIIGTKIPIIDQKITLSIVLLFTFFILLCFMFMNYYDTNIHKKVNNPNKNKLFF